MKFIASSLSSFCLLLALSNAIHDSTAIQLDSANEDPISMRAMDLSGKRPLCSYHIDKMKKDIKKILTGFKLAHALRMSFHACVGGCDGCLNRDLRANSGQWLPTLDEIDRLFDTQCFIKRRMSRADFYYLVGISAVEKGIENANKGITDPSQQMPTIDIPFNVGRVDCATSPSTTAVGNFPDGKENFAEMLNFYKTEFNLTADESIALNGAHTVGGASGASGYSGIFKQGGKEFEKFNTGYYKLLLDTSLNWTQVDNAPKIDFPIERWQWEAYNNQNGKQESFMLNSDMSQVIQIAANSKGESSCERSTCQTNTASEPIVQKFANNAADWLADFKTAFIKMSNKGAGALKTPDVCP